MLSSTATRGLRADAPRRGHGVKTEGLPPSWRNPRTGGVVLAVIVAVGAWLPFLHAPLTSDESGFLFVARHWVPGTSLYGDYWVDRPPLLMGLFSLADQFTSLGPAAGDPTAPAVKLLGAAASGGSVLLTGVVARLVSPGRRRPHMAAVAAAVVLLSSPLLGLPETDGELLAVPFVLLGLVLLVAALRRPGDRLGLLLAAGAGASAMSAVLVKQNVVDVFVFALAVLLVRPRSTIPLAGRVLAFLGAGTAAIVTAAVAAASRGTSPTDVWNAVVVFRLQAFAVIGSSASEDTPARMAQLAGAFVASGAAALLVVTVWLSVGRRRRHQVSRDDSVLGVEPNTLTWPVLAMVTWELCGVVLGGSYWLHYLTGLVPGLVMLVALVDPRRWRFVVAACVVYAAVANGTAWAYRVTAPHSVSSDAQVMSYLRKHSDRGDGVVVAFGHPDIIAGSGLASPYPQLWSLPVRVRDPQLRDLEEVMSGPRAPRWIVVAGETLDSWGLDAQAAQGYLERHYIDRVTYGDWHVWQRREGAR